MTTARPKEKAVTILGMGPTAAQYKDDIMSECIGEVWTCNDAYLMYPGLDANRWFELHTWDYLKTWKGQTDGMTHMRYLDKQNCHVYTRQPLPGIRFQGYFPGARVACALSSNYWIGTPSYMISLALFEGFTHIKALGIDTADDRHKQQRAAWAYWIRVAQERGVLISGSACWFMAEPEQDDGLQGLRELYGDEAQNRIDAHTKHQEVA